MGQSRRQFLAGAAVTTLGATVVGVPQVAQARERLSTDRVARLFADLPGTVSFKIVSAGPRRKHRVNVSSNSATRLFIGSSFKAFVLAEALRQADSPDVVKT